MSVEIPAPVVNQGYYGGYYDNSYSPYAGAQSKHKQLHLHSHQPPPCCLCLSVSCFSARLLLTRFVRCSAWPDAQRPRTRQLLTNLHSKAAPCPSKCSQSPCLPHTLFRRLQPLHALLVLFLLPGGLVQQLVPWEVGPQRVSELSASLSYLLTKPTLRGLRGGTAGSEAPQRSTAAIGSILGL